MLKISIVDSSANAVRLRLEGRLIGAWVGELKSYSALVRGEGNRLSLDLTDVLFADRAGVALLRALQKSGVELLSCPPLIAQELSQL